LKLSLSACSVVLCHYSSAIYGHYEAVKALIAYYRQQGERKFLIICNFSSLDQKLDLPKATVVLSNYKRSEEIITDKEGTIIKPFEGILLELS
jgi:hypothetical protein